MSKTSRILSEVGRELRRDEPAVVGRTRRKKGAAAAQKQRTAILLSKARRLGAQIARD